MTPPSMQILESSRLTAIVQALQDARQIPQELVFLGGPSSAPGYDFHALVGRFGATQRVEWQAPVPFFAIPLGRFGKAPATATLAPFLHAAYVARPVALPWLGEAATAPEAMGGWRPSAGVGALLFFDLLRVDVARGLRDGRWSASVDVGRAFWGVL